jgi:hypothetical protein
MNMREQQVNDALRALDEMRRLSRIERDEYRRRRRQLLESLCDATGCSGPDTVRRAVPRHDDGNAEVRALRGRRSAARLAAVCAVVLGVVACAAVCWFLMTG